MSPAANINSRIVEGLYCEALVLSDEVRCAFDLSGRIDRATEDGSDLESAGRVALSCEALRTTTRMMHAIAWLLNHRAYLAGDLSEFQLRRHGRLSADFPAADGERMAVIEPRVGELIRATEAFYARLLRIDRGMREREHGQPSAIDRLRERLGRNAA